MKTAPYVDGDLGDPGRRLRHTIVSDLTPANRASPHPGNGDCRPADAGGGTPHDDTTRTTGSADS